MTEVKPNQFLGRVCPKHPDDGGLRYVSGRQKCVACQKAAVAAWHEANRDKEKARRASIRADPDKSKVVSAYSAAYRAANADKLKAQGAAYRAANADKIKARKAAYRAANADRLKAKSAAYYAANIDKFKEYGATYRAANADRLKVEKSAWRTANAARLKAKREANIEKSRQYEAARYAANREALLAKNAAWRAANPDKEKARHKTWKAANPDKLRAIYAKRRATETQRTPPWADLDVIEGIYKFASLCGREAHVDHIVPLRGKLVSGLHVSWNLRVVFAEENLKKNAKHDPWTFVHVLPDGV